MKLSETSMEVPESIPKRKGKRKKRKMSLEQLEKMIILVFQIFLLVPFCFVKISNGNRVVKESSRTQK